MKLKTLCIALCIAGAAQAQRPDHVNNALAPCFPAVFNQDGGSCGSASRICYMLAHELNSYRHADGRLPQNIYPSHFTWLLTNSNSGKEQMAAANGVPSADVYGGTTYSRLLGNQDCAAPDFGWMQGYDKWYAAMFNRISHNSFAPQGVDTPEGRELLKNWLWNHCGDTDFSTGGIAGIGVASACHQDTIADDSAGVNRRAGVVGMKYVTRWGDGVDHALTIVGYDDRILFDLDGNGIAGEEDKDERGAWIIVNSWGSGWANGGFIYCPYKYGYPVRQNEGGAWHPEFYHIRKDYRPRRTLKLKMQYSRRSELKLSVGIAAQPGAVKPDTVVEMHHFRFAGDGRWGDQKKDGEALTPMLGRWADGLLHDEPMEFGYDLTDLTEKHDTRRPLKYFLIIDSRDKAEGEGRVLAASVIDYDHDTLGIETPLHIGSGLCIQNGGRRTLATAVVQGSADSLTHADSLLLAAFPRPSARFTLSAPAKAGERVSLLPASPMPGARYAWTLSGADRDTAHTMLTAATFEQAGDYRVALSVTNPLTGKTARSRMKIHVEGTAPVAGFDLSPAVVLRGEEFTLTDRSRYAPDTREWMVESRRYAVSTKGRTAKLRIDAPGVYDVTLTAANAYGKDRSTRKKALVVCNADSRNGLLFSNPKARVEATAPYAEATERLTVEWWMNAADNTFGLGDSAGAWLVSADKDGRLTLHADSLSAASPKGFVECGSWHHYAVVFHRGEVLYYKDGERAGNATLGNKNHVARLLPAPESLLLGGEKNPVSGAIDELRIWHKALGTDTLRQYANAPVADIQKAQQADSLLLYYDFNQNGGDVQDRTSHQRHGRRIDFGPDGDAWGLSQGVFCLNFANEPEDLSELLPQSALPFASTGRTVNTRDAKRFTELDLSAGGKERIDGGKERVDGGKAWMAEGFAGADTLRTGVHVDHNKGGALTVATGWDGFAHELRNHKLYTTLTLPAGRYELEIEPWSGLPESGSLLCAAPGRGLPSAGDKDAPAPIATAPLSRRSLTFVLDKETELSLGFVFSLQGQTCIAISRIRLWRSEYEVK